MARNVKRDPGGPDTEASETEVEEGAAHRSTAPEALDAGGAPGVPDTTHALQHISGLAPPRAAANPAPHSKEPPVIARKYRITGGPESISLGGQIHKMRVGREVSDHATDVASLLRAGVTLEEIK